MIRRALSIALVLLLALAAARPAAATDDPVRARAQAAIIEHLGNTLDLGLEFRDAHGRSVTLGDLMIPGRPSIIVPVYYTCPRICPLTLGGLASTLRELDLKLGDDFSVITVSFDPDEDPELAAKRASEYRAQLGPETSGGAWHFLTGSRESIAALTDEIGFGYSRDGADFVHAALMVVIAPDGTISRYFYGVTHSARDVRLSLVDAAQGRIGTTLDRALLYCFSFDPSQGKYSLVIMRVVRVVSLGVFGLLAAFLLLLRIKELRKRKDSARHA